MKAGFRQSMAWLHAWGGLILGWLLFAMAATGTASVFKSEISDWMRPEVRVRADPADAVTAAVRYLSVAAPNAGGWYMDAPDDRLAATIVTYDFKNASGADDYRLAALDPVTGRPDAIRDTLGGEFFYRFHFELQLPYPWGRILASAAGMLMLIVLISGIVTHRRIFADFFTMRPGKGKRSWLDAHNVLGVLALPFHLMISFTGVLTLITLTLPWAIAANYGSDTARAFADLDPGYYTRPRVGTPAPIGDVHAMLTDARARLGGAIGRVTMENPNDAGAVLLIYRNDSNGIGYDSGVAAYDAVTGKLLSAYAEQRPAKGFYNLLYGLHMGRFAPAFSRWLYFLCGLALAATIASGLLLWTIGREKEGGLGNAFVSRLTAGATGGLPLAMAGFFLANRILPVTLAGRQDAEVRVFFLIWGLATLFGLLRRPARAWIEIVALTACAWLALPLVSAITVGLPHDIIGLGFDGVALALGGAFVAAIPPMLRKLRAVPKLRERRT